jgi:lysophospholipid acyltransferase (LPLAT)-like uncharacterized protein
VSGRARLIGLAGSLLIRALGATWRVRVIGREHEAACRDAGRGLLYAFWHGQLLPLLYFMRRRGILVLVSQNTDGEYIAQVIHREGFDTVRGSSSRGGFRSLLEMTRAGESGRALGISPDGPRGPRHRAQPGVLLVAQRAGVPILPLAAAARPRRELDSWDRFVIPAPIARVVRGCGAPIHLPADLGAEKLLAEWTEPVERALTELGERCERELEVWSGRAAPAAKERA